MFDRAALARAVAAHARVVRVVLAEARGSTPREAGAAMLVWNDGQSGTIGGGRLELEATRNARAMLADGPAAQLQRHALGPALKQCCGGAVSVVFELFDADRLNRAQAATGGAAVHARPVSADAADRKPGKLARQNSLGGPMLCDGWLAEPVRAAPRPVYIYGAGHVGLALARVLAPLPGFEVHLVDVREHQMRDLPEEIHTSWDALPTDILARAPDTAAHLIMTPEHDYDLELCHRLLSRSFSWAGLIGSETKWARFRTRLTALGHSGKQIARINCPIGDPALGKHPQAIAVGVAAALLRLPADQPDKVRSTA